MVKGSEPPPAADAAAVAGTPHHAPSLPRCRFACTGPAVRFRHPSPLRRPTSARRGRAGAVSAMIGVTAVTSAVSAVTGAVIAMTGTVTALIGVVSSVIGDVTVGPSCRVRASTSESLEHPEFHISTRSLPGKCLIWSFDSFH